MLEKVLNISVVTISLFAFVLCLDIGYRKPFSVNTIVYVANITLIFISVAFMVASVYQHK